LPVAGVEGSTWNVSLDGLIAAAACGDTGEVRRRLQALVLGCHLDA
jgi:hypothetical protein